MRMGDSIARSVRLTCAAAVLAGAFAVPAWAQCAGAGCTPGVSVTQDVAVTNTIDDNHAETHADNGGLSSDGGAIVLGTSTSRSHAEQAAGNRQRVAARRRAAKGRRAAARRRAASDRRGRSVDRREAAARRRAARRRAARQNAELTNWLHNNSAATSANTGESSHQASTTTGDTISEVTSRQSAANDQAIDLG